MSLSLKPRAAAALALLSPKQKTIMKIIWTTAAAALALTVYPASAQKYPQKPVRMIVPYAPGGPTDILARAVAQAMSEAWGQAVIIDNKPGASGNLGTALAAKAAADGYTLAAVGISYSVAPSLEAKLGYDPLKDLTPVALFASVNNLLVVHPSLPAKNVKELIALAKARPGVLNYASTSVGAGNHVAAELFNNMAGVNIVRINYKSMGAGFTDVLSGQIQVMFPSANSATQYVKSGFHILCG